MADVGISVDARAAHLAGRLAIGDAARHSDVCDGLVAADVASGIGGVKLALVHVDEARAHERRPERRERDQAAKDARWNVQHTQSPMLR